MIKLNKVIVGVALIGTIVASTGCFSAKMRMDSNEPMLFYGLQYQSPADATVAERVVRPFDIPLSLAIDTALLPFDVIDVVATNSSKKKAEKKAKQVALDAAVKELQLSATIGDTETELITKEEAEILYHQHRITNNVDLLSKYKTNADALVEEKVAKDEKEAEAILKAVNDKVTANAVAKKKAEEEALKKKNEAEALEKANAAEKKAAEKKALAVTAEKELKKITSDFNDAKEAAKKAEQAAKAARAAAPPKPKKEADVTPVVPAPKQ